MRVLVCGSRDWDDKEAVWTALDGLAANFSCHKMDERRFVVIAGGAKGADSWAEAWVPTGTCACACPPELETHKPDWDAFGKAAGPIRNQKMLDEGAPDVVLAFTDNLGASRGTKDMVVRAHKAGVPVYVIGRYRGVS